VFASPPVGALAPAGPNLDLSVRRGATSVAQWRAWVVGRVCPRLQGEVGLLPRGSLGLEAALLVGVAPLRLVPEPRLSPHQLAPASGRVSRSSRFTAVLHGSFLQHDPLRLVERALGRVGHRDGDEPRALDAEHALNQKESFLDGEETVLEAAAVVGHFVSTSRRISTILPSHSGWSARGKLLNIPLFFPFSGSRDHCTN
jgi:hypothetical protein